MSTVKRKGDRTNPTWITRFWAVVKYELLWNIRKKKFLGMLVIAFALATLSLALQPILSNINGQPLSQNPDYVIGSGAGIGGLGLFLFAVVTVMNSISGEFESGTIVPLLTKPVSRTMVFLGKLFAAFITLLSAYAVLFVYMTIGGTIVYGPQNNLHLVPLSLLGSILSTFVWIAIVLAIGSISKSSLIAALGALGVFMALFISAPIVSAFSDQAWILTYVPGSGASGYIVGLGSQTPYTPGMAVSTGTDNIAANLINYVLHPSADVTFFKIGGFSAGEISWTPLYAEPLSLALLRSIIVAATYIFVFLFISWYAFKRAQVLE
jgi:ABC-type transport system involved in multi-copper enzyme maturation permease subunit